MNLKELAMDALKQDELDLGNSEAKGQEDSPFAIEENPDGTTTISVLVTFDPKIREEKAKAMAKGVKRDDLADDIPDDGGDEHQSSPETAEDSAPRGVFGAALDELVGELGEAALDAAPKSRHGLSPIENCRAKDPMFCPYHGQTAIKEAVEAELKKAGQTNFKVEVTPQGKGFLVKATLPKKGPYSSFSAQPLQRAFMSGRALKQGITLAPPKPISQNMNYGYGVNIDYTPTDEIGATVVTPAQLSDDEKQVAMLDEWIDDLVTDIADDPTLMQDLDPQDLKDLLDSREVLEASINTQNPQQFAADYKFCRDKYRTARAQADYRHIKTPLDAKDAEDTIENEMQTLKGDYHAAKAPIDAAKKVLFKNRKFPNGFAKANPWAKAYNDLSSAVGYFATKSYDDARLADLNLAPVDVKGRRTAISEMEYAKELYKNALDKYKQGIPAFMKEFEDWAQGELSAGRITQQQFDTAFPQNAQSQQTTSSSAANKQNSSGKVNLPQSWNNFVMGDNLVMPTDGLSDIPYGSEKGFRDAFEGSFPYFQVPDAFESFEINPISGEVVYSMAPGVAVSKANAPKCFVNALWGAGYTGAKLRPLTNGKPGFEVVIPFNANLAGK